MRYLFVSDQLFFVAVDAMIAHPEKRFYLQNTESVQFFIIMSVLISFYPGDFIK